MCVIASQITSLTIAYSTVYSDADQRKHQSSASLAFVRGIHRGPVNSLHKWPVPRKNIYMYCRIYFGICFRNCPAIRKLLNSPMVNDKQDILCISEGCFDIKVSSYQYIESLSKDNMVSWPSYLLMEIPIHGMTTFVLRQGLGHCIFPALVIVLLGLLLLTWCNFNPRMDM